MTNPIASLGSYLKRLDDVAQQLVEALDMVYAKYPYKDQETYSKYLEAVGNYKDVHAELYGRYFPSSESK